MANFIWEQLTEGTLKYAIDKVGSVSFVASHAFAGCDGLLAVSLPSATQIETKGFVGCTNLYIANIPGTESIGTSAFYNCTRLKLLSVQGVTTIGWCGFGQTGIVSAVFPNTVTVGVEAFIRCNLLNYVEFRDSPTINNNAFNRCTSLFSLYLYGSTVCSLVSTDAFFSSPMVSSVGGRYGSIYVPASLYNGYKAAVNWSAFASRFVAIE